MNRSLLIIIISILLTGCAQIAAEMKTEMRMITGKPKVRLQEVAADPGYGFSQEKPVKVGGFPETGGHENQLVYLNQLRGPNGERITFLRNGPCCEFATPYGYNGYGLLDVYTITYAGAKKEKQIYIDSYEYDHPKAPQGLTIATDPLK